MASKSSRGAEAKLYKNMLSGGVSICTGITVIEGYTTAIVGGEPSSVYQASIYPRPTTSCNDTVYIFALD